MGEYYFLNYTLNEENKLTGDAIPGRNQLRDFLIYYLQETKRLDYSYNFESGRDSIRNLMRETDYGIVLYYLYIRGLLRPSFDTYIKPLPTFGYLYKILRL